MSLRWQCLCIGSTDPARLARWWAGLLGWRITYEDDDEVALEPPQGSSENGVSPDVLFLRVPEGKAREARVDGFQSSQAHRCSGVKPAHGEHSQVTAAGCAAARGKQ